MFVDDGGWGRSGEPKPDPRRVVPPRRESIVLRRLMVNVVAVVIAPIGGGAILGVVAALFAHLR